MDDKNPKVARFASMAMFRIRLADLDTGETDDPEPILEELRQFVAEKETSEHVFLLGMEAAVTLGQSGRRKETVEVLRLVGNAFKDNEDEQIASDAATMLEQVMVIEMQDDLAAVMDGKKEVLPQLLEKIKAFLQPENLEPSAFEMTMTIARTLEQADDLQPALEVYALMKEAFKDSEDQTFARMVTNEVEMGERRLGLLGKPLLIEGVLFGGEPFDWSKYKGKVVLVDFWATWCVYCIREFPNIRENYDRFHEKGFEVVGVNVDEDPREVERFFAAGGLPWATVLSSDPEKTAFSNPNAVRCGLTGMSGIPFTVLVGKDGNVVALHVRGKQLGEKLQALLGDADTPLEEPR